MIHLTSHVTERRPDTTGDKRGLVNLKLDDIAFLRRSDPANMLKTLGKWPSMIEEGIRLAEEFSIPSKFRKVNSVVIAGVGGSGIAGDLVCSWLHADMRIPVISCRAYSLPSFVNSRTLVIAVSFSGETEETLSCFTEASKRHASLLSVSSGGRLESYSKKLRVPHIKIPGGIPPRMGLPYLFSALAMIMSVLNAQDKFRDLRPLTSFLESLRSEYSPESRSRVNDAKSLALSIGSRIPVIYSYPPFDSVAMRMKSDFNENAKTPVKWAVLPELKHNEALGWMSGRKFIEFAMIFLRDSEEDELLRIDVENLLRHVVEERFNPIVNLHSRGASLAQRLFSLVYLGGYASVYLGLLKGVDPGNIEVIRKLKEEMRQRSGIIDKLDRMVDTES